MILAGDESLRTQRGNNNAYCQDNEVSWVNWHLARAGTDLAAFCRRLVAFRSRHPSFRIPEWRDSPDIVWFEADGREADWATDRSTLALFISSDGEDSDFYIMLNAAQESIEFKAPSSGGSWYVVIDTHRPAIYDEPAAEQHVLPPRSLVVLQSGS